jgi:predicted XRE-type DNA-binding protein
MKGKKKKRIIIKRKLENEINKERFKFIYINGIKTQYKVSNKGYVISVNYRNTGKLVRLSEEYNHGYKRVSLYLNGKIYHKRVHRLVAEAFIPNPEKYNVVHHKDDNKSNNYISNLEWATSKQNSLYAVDSDLILGGMNHPMNKYNEELIHNVCECLEENQLSIKEISEKCGVPVNTINNIRLNNQWKIISSGYNIDNYNIRDNSAKLDDSTVIKIAEYIMENKLSNKEIANIFSIKPYIVSDIKQKKTYSNITKDYDFPIIRQPKKRKK